MARPVRIQRENAFYHITSRGNRREVIFHNAEDYERFVEQLQHTVKSYDIVLYAYVLMNNHYHLLIRTLKANLSRFIQRLNTSYSLYYRYKHKKPGHCFQGRFGAKIIQSDSYLKSLSRYIHLNPVKVKSTNKLRIEEKMEDLKNYKWCSLRGYLDKKYEEGFVCYDILRAFDIRIDKARAIYNKYLIEKIEISNDETQKIMNASSYAIGDENFIRIIENELRGLKKGKRKDYDLDYPRKKMLEIKEIDEEIKNKIGLKASEIKKNDRSKMVIKATAIELAVHFTDLSLRMIGEYFGGLSPSGVGMIRKYFKENDLEASDYYKELKLILEKRIKEKNFNRREIR